MKKAIFSGTLSFLVFLTLFLCSCSVPVPLDTLEAILTDYIRANMDAFSS